MSYEIAFVNNKTVIYCFYDMITVLMLMEFNVSLKKYLQYVFSLVKSS